MNNEINRKRLILSVGADTRVRPYNCKGSVGVIEMSAPSVILPCKMPPPPQAGEALKVIKNIKSGQ